MKNLIKKVRHHGKKITVHLKSQPKWVVRCMFGIGAIFGLVLSLHAHPIGGTNAQSIECPEGQYLATGNVCITNEKDIVIQATATEANQRLTINKYFANDYIVDRGDESPITLLSEDTRHTYSTLGTYNIILSLTGDANRWTFTGGYRQPLVPRYGTNMTGIEITYMPTLADGFGDSATNPGDYFFTYFNGGGGGALTNLPDGSFDISNITTVGDNFFSEFNREGELTSLPVGSFILSTGLTTVGDNFFDGFNRDGNLTNLPDGSFDISNITTVGDNFFYEFNYNFHFNGALTSLPDGSFNISNITTVGDNFFSSFGGGKLTNLPEGSFILSTGLTTVGNDFFSDFVGGALTSLPDGSFNISNITTVGDRFFSSFGGRVLTSLPEGSFILSTGLTTVGDGFFSSFGGGLTSLPGGSFNISNITTVGDEFFSSFGGVLTSLPEGSFILSTGLTTVGDNFFSDFVGGLTSLPDGSFNISNITTVGDRFFSSFGGRVLTSLPEGSFILSTGLTTVGNDFFSDFVGGALTSLPTGSFDTSNITTVGNNFFSYFNSNGLLTSLPDGSFNISNITTVGDGFFSYFNNYNGALTSLPDGSFRLSPGLTTVGNDFFLFFNGGFWNTGGALTNLPDGSFDISNITTVGNNFFAYFNSEGALTSLPTGSFDTSNITTVGNNFFSYFNSNGLLTSLPDGSFRLSPGLTTVNNSFFGSFNSFGKLTSLPAGSFDTSNITSVGNFFFDDFNADGKLTSLPDRSFDMSNITTVGNRFFSYFNSNGALTSLPDSFKLNSVGSQSVSGYMGAFNSPYTLNKRVSDLVSGIVAPLDYRNMFSSNQPGRCGVHENWLKNKTNACSISYDNGMGGTWEFRYDADTTGVVAGSGMAMPAANGYTFEGRYTVSGVKVEGVIFPDMDGKTLYARWIDDINPTCNVAYSTIGATTGNVIASLTGCSETITGTYLQHTFTGNGTYTFRFQDLAGNAGSAEATVTWIISGDNTTYFDIEGNEFRWDDLTICNPDNSRECITIMDRNLGATTNNISRTGSYGYHYQWGNNHGFTPFDDSVKTNAIYDKINTNNFGPLNPYYGMQFISISAASGQQFIDWSIENNHNLWGGSGDDLDNNWGYPVKNPSERQGPCPDDYHVPSAGEWNKLLEYRVSDYTGDIRNDNELLLSYYVGEELGNKFREDLKIPFAGGRDNGANGNNIGSTARIRSSSPIINTHSSSLYTGNSLSLYLNSGGVFTSNNNPRINALSVRCFKNNTGYLSVDSGITFSISIDDTVKVGEYTDFTVKVMKDGTKFKGYTGTIYFQLTDQKGNTIDNDIYDFSEKRSYKFSESDQGKKVFKNGLRIKKAGTYRIEIFDLDDNEGFETIVAKGGHSSAAMEFDTLKFNPYYSNEMNKAYQYSRYYDITTKDNIKEANMYGGLDRVAMAKMLANYAENVLGIDNFDTSRNCKFVDVPASLDRDYGYGVTKACQLGIMGVNMQDNKFRPYDSVSRAEFATALSRLLYGTKDGTDKYYSTHISKLYKEGIISNTDPNLKELRGYVMLMLMRSDEDYVPEEIEYPATYSVNKIDTTVRTIYTEGCNWYTITQNPHGNNTYMPNKNWTDDIKFVNKALQDVRDNGEHLVKNYIDEANRVLDSAGLTKRDQCKYSLLIDELEHQDGAIKSYKNENGKITIGIDFISYKENITWDDYDDWNGRDLKKNTSTKLRYYTVSDNAEFETINVDNNGVLGTNYTKFIHNRDTRLNNFCNNEPIYYHIDDEELQYIAGYQKFGTYFNGGRYYNHNGGDKDRYCIKRQIESGGTSGRFAFDSKGQVNKIMKGYYFDCVWCS